MRKKRQAKRDSALEQGGFMGREYMAYEDDSSNEESSEEIGSEQEISSEDEELDEEHEENGSEQEDTSDEESHEEIESEQEDTSDDDEHEEIESEQEGTSNDDEHDEIESEQEDTCVNGIEGGGGKGGDAIRSKSGREIKKAVRPSRACKVLSRVCLEDTDEIEESEDTVTPKTPPRRRPTLYRLATKQSEYDFQIGTNKSSKK